MSKPFFEVFPTLKVDDELRGMFEQAEVSKVTTNSDRDFIKVHLLSRYLIQKKCICEVERRLKEQLFGRSYIQIEVMEQYDLSEQYTPENLMKEYFDSFLFELDQRSVVERSMLQNSSFEFQEENILCLTLRDSIVAQGKRDSITSYLTEVFRHRFGRPIEIRVLYEKPKESALKYNEIKLKQEVEEILKANIAVRQENGRQMGQQADEDGTFAAEGSFGQKAAVSQSGSGGSVSGGGFENGAAQDESKSAGRNAGQESGKKREKSAGVVGNGMGQEEGKAVGAGEVRQSGNRSGGRFGGSFGSSKKKGFSKG